MEFHQTLVNDAVEATDEQIRFWRLRGQGQGQIFEWVIVVSAGIHIDALASKYHLEKAKF